jgi:1,4-alpha-glucan branching enzyme
VGADFVQQGFEWISRTTFANTIAYRGKPPGRQALYAYKLLPVHRDGYLLGVDSPGKYDEIFNSDRAEYGGGGR